MSERALHLAARRAAILAESARLRRSLGEEGAALAQRLAVVERVFAVGRSGWVRPVLVGAVGLLMVGRTRRILSIASRLAVVYPLIKRVVQLFSRRPSRGRGRDPQFPRDRAGSPDTSESP